MSWFEYLNPSQDEVVIGLEAHEKIYALEQKDYMPVRTLPGENGNSAIIRWALTPEQRQLIAEGADVMLELFHFGGPLPPSRIMLLNQNAALMSPETKRLFCEWFQAQTKGPYDP